MQRKGVSYLIHRALANVAQELRVVKVAIDNVVSPVLMSTCEKWEWASARMLVVSILHRML